MNNVVITGIGAVTPLGNNFSKNWSNVLKGNKNFNYDEILDIVMGKIDDNFNDSLNSKEKRYQDRSAQLATISTREAIQDSCLTKKYLEKFIISVGTSIGGINTTINEVTKSVKNNDLSSVDLKTILKMLPNMIAANISIENSIHGSSNTYSSACASGSVSIGEAYLKIKNGLSDGAIAVGVESCLNNNSLIAFKKLGVLANDSLLNASVPFSKERRGFVISEGSCTLILENKKIAEKRNAKIYAEIVGYGNSSDGYSLVAPSLNGMELAMKNALDDASIKPNDITYINAHGTSTLANDRVESEAIYNIFNEGPKVSSTKSLSGHMLGGSGALEAALSCNMLSENIIVKQFGFERQDVDQKLKIKNNLLFNNKLLNNKLLNNKNNYIMSNSFAFGGMNSVLIFKNNN